MFIIIIHKIWLNVWVRFTIFEPFFERFPLSNPQKVYFFFARCARNFLGRSFIFHRISPNVLGAFYFPQNFSKYFWALLGRGGGVLIIINTPVLSIEQEQTREVIRTLPNRILSKLSQFPGNCQPILWNVMTTFNCKRDNSSTNVCKNITRRSNKVGGIRLSEMPRKASQVAQFLFNVRNLESSDWGFTSVFKPSQSMLEEPFV